MTGRASREPPGATEGSARHRLQHANVFIKKGTEWDGAWLSRWPQLSGSGAIGQPQEEGRREQREEDQRQAGGWPVNTAASQQRPDPVEVPTDVGVDTGPVGPPTA